MAPGLNGVVPQLSLNYSSQSGEGIAGGGWNLGGLSGISRIPSTKFHDGIDDPIDFDALDRFALDGQRLIVKAGTTGVYGANNTVYETENFSNVKITSFGVHPNGTSYGPAYFKVEYPDGSWATYGNNTSRSIVSWGIDYWQNPQAVSINYFYTTANNTLYIDAIKYGATAINTTINEIKFIYGIKEKEQAYFAGILIEDNKQLAVIDVVGLRKYVFTLSFTQSIYFPYDFIKSFKIEEKNSNGSLVLNPTIFKYGNYKEEDAKVNMRSANNYSGQNFISISGNFNGDAISDYIIMPTNLSLNELHFGKDDATTNNWPIPAFGGLALESATYIKTFVTSFIKDDKLYPRNGWTVIKRRYPNQNGEFDFHNFYYDSNLPNVVLQQVKTINIASYGASSGHYTIIPANFYPGDFNGDGITDVLSILSVGSVNKVILTDLNTNVPTNYNTYFGTIDYVQTGPATSFINKDSKVEIIDFNGDGQSDFLIHDSTGIKVYTLSKTNISIILLSHSPNYGVSALDVLNANFNVYLGDFNGDGKTDIALQSKVNNTDIWRFLISTGVTFTSFVKSIGVLYQNNEENSYFVFHEQDPISGVVFRKDAKTRIYQDCIVSDFDGDGKTDILVNKKEISSHVLITSSLGTYSVDYTYQNMTWSHKFNLKKNVGLLGNDITFTDGQNIARPSNCFNHPGCTNCSGGSGPIINPIQQICNIPDDGNNALWDIPMIDSNGNLTLIKGHKIQSFNFKKERRKNFINEINTGNGVKEQIGYSAFTKTDGYNSIYPNIDISPVSKSLLTVSQIIKTSKNHKTAQIFNFSDPVFNTYGLGFLGFKKSYRSDWFDYTNTSNPNYSKVLFNIYKSDLFLSAANTESWQVFDKPNANFDLPTTVYFSKSVNTYNTLADALQTNKVFKLKNTKTETWNSLSNTSSESTSVLDIYNNPTTVTTNVKNGTVIEKTTVNTIIYDNQPTATTFVIGRPTSKIVNTTIYPGQADQDISIAEEQYTYTNHLLTQIKKRATNSGIQTPFLTEDNIFDAFGNITKKTITAVGETPRVTNFEYSATYGSRFLTKSIDVELLETVYTYDPITGLVLTELMPSIAGFPLLTTNTYDTWGKKIKVKNYLDKEITYVYARDVEKTLITETSDDGSSTTELYDDLGRKIVTGSKTIDGTWAYTDKVYDNFDRTIKVSEPYFTGATKLWNETTFDEYGRPTQIKAATGKTANYTYAGYLTTNVNDGTLNKTNVKNALDNVISLTDTPGGTIAYKYFANGNLKKTIFDGQETIISQDGWGRKSKLIEPSAGEYNYTYNGFGQALTETSFNGTTTYTYNNIGKLNTKWVKGKPSTDGTFSGTNILSTYAYYNLPNKKMLESVTVTNPNDGNSIYSYTYDDFKRINYTKEDFTTIAPRKFENTIAYDLFGRTEYETSIASINGFSQTKVYFNEYKNGELWKKRENNASGNTVWTLNNRNARGQITSATLGNNLIAQTNTYHDLGYTLQTVHNKIGTPSVNIMTLVNTYDEPRGNMLTRSNSLFGWNETFNYDFQDRLTEFTNKLGAQTTQDYEDNGKIKSNTLGSYKYSTAKPYQNTAIKLSPDGLLEPGLMQVQTIKYTAFKAPISIEQGTQRAYFGYNFAQDRSVMYFGNSNTNKLLQPTRRFYSADGTMEITQTLATGNYEFTTYIGGDAYTAPALVRQTNNASSSIFYLHRDHLGTILAITNSSGDVVEKRLFDAWGDIIKVQNGAGANLVTLTFINRGYTGHEHLQQFRLINMNGRLYDPRLHRFLQPDNNLQEPYNTQNYNRYGYVLNNPLKYTDPTGEESDSLFGSLWEGIAWVGSTIALSAKSVWNESWFQQARSDASNWFGRNGQSLNNWADKNLRSIGNSWDSKSNNTFDKTNRALNSNGKIYGGDGSGSFLDQLSLFGYEINQFNPVANIWNAISGYATGLDSMGNPINNQESTMSLAMAIPISKFATGAKVILKVEQYSLRAIESGFYPVMERGFFKAQELVYLEKDEIWKFGTTINPFKRYTQKYLLNRGEKGLYYFREFEGTLSEALKLEKMKIMNFFEQNGFLPWGNKIAK